VFLVGHAGRHGGVLSGEDGNEQQYVGHMVMLNLGVDSRVKRRVG
jgi:hypothetical protein